MLGDRNTFSSFAVDDVAVARKFYGETLGLRTTVLDEDAGLLALNLAGGRDVIVYAKPDFVPATYTVLNFEVDDVEAAVGELSERGVTFERYEGFAQDAKGVARGQGPDIAWFKDPAGNIFAVLTPG